MNARVIAAGDGTPLWLSGRTLILTDRAHGERAFARPGASFAEHTARPLVSHTPSRPSTPSSRADTQDERGSQTRLPHNFGALTHRCTRPVPGASGNPWISCNVACLHLYDHTDARRLLHGTQNRCWRIARNYPPETVKQCYSGHCTAHRASSLPSAKTSAPARRTAALAEEKGSRRGLVLLTWV
jgi:hypothetical protein